MLIIMSGAFLFRAPVYFRDDDGIGIDHRHLLPKLRYLGLRVGVLVTTAVPSAVVVNGISYIVALNGMRSISGIVGLPAGAGHPNNARKPVGSYLVHYRLKEVVQGLRVVLTSGILEVHRFVGELYTYLSGVFADRVALCEEVPDRHQIVVVVVSHLYVSRTHAGRPHHNIHAMVHGPFGQREIERNKVVLQSARVELSDVCLARCVTGLPF